MELGIKKFAKHMKELKIFNTLFHKIKFNTIKKGKHEAEGKSTIHQLTNLQMN